MYCCNVFILCLITQFLVSKFKRFTYSLTSSDRFLVFGIDAMKFLAKSFQFCLFVCLCQLLVSNAVWAKGGPGGGGAPAGGGGGGPKGGDAPKGGGAGHFNDSIPMNVQFPPPVFNNLPTGGWDGPHPPPLNNHNPVPMAAPDAGNQGRPTQYQPHPTQYQPHTIEPLKAPNPNPTYHDPQPQLDNPAPDWRSNPVPTAPAVATPMFLGWDAVIGHAQEEYRQQITLPKERLGALIQEKHKLQESARKLLGKTPLS
jgi:hypothetical protein